MKIAISVFRSIPASDGIALRAQKISSLIGADHQISIISKSKGGRKLPNERSWLITMPLRIVESIWWNLKLSYIVLRNRYDIVYCVSDFFGFMSLYVWSKIRRYHIIYEAQSILPGDLKELHYPGVIIRASQAWEGFVMKCAEYVIAVAPNILEYCNKYNKKVGLVNVFVDDDLFSARDNKNNNKNSKIIGLIGPFNTPRNRESLLFLYSNIDKFDKRLNFLVVGYCAENDRITGERIAYTGYLNSITDYVYHLQRLDAVLIPETTGTTGPLNKIIEPMSCSLPVFTTPKGEVGLYWVQPGKDIFVFEKGEMVDKVNNLVFDDELMTTTGNNARITVEKYYGKKTNRKRLLEILDLVLNV